MRTFLRIVAIVLGLGALLGLLFAVITENDPSRPRWLSPVWMIALAVLGGIALVATRGSSAGPKRPKQ